MKVGVIARATDRGLGVQTAEAARNLDASVLVVDVRNPSGRRFPTDPTRFPGAPIVECLPGWRLSERVVKNWLNGVDVVYSAETFYDERVTEWARTHDAKTVIHANPEFVPKLGGWAIGNPDAWWSATCWRNDRMPAPTRVVTFPVAADRFTTVEPHGRPCRWLHVAGKHAVADRNGTETVIAALAHLKRPCTVTICTQEDSLPARAFPAQGVTVNVVTGGTANYWDLYANHDALVMPRRYGGLCLPVQEAMAAGMAVLMTDVSPNPQTWPVATCPTSDGGTVRTPAGKIPVHSGSPHDLAAAMDRFADVEVRHELQARSRGWAQGNSWDALRPVWLDLFARL